MENFLETYSLPNLNQEVTDNFNRLIIRDERESVLKKKNSLQKKSRTIQLHWGILPNKELTPIFLQLLQKTEEGTPPMSFYEAIITLIPKPDKTLQKKKIIGWYL